MERYAVIGNPIDHSLSPFIHHNFAKQFGLSLTYEKILGDNFEQQVLDFFLENGKGLNVTLPFKQRAYALSSNSTYRAQCAGAGNTLWMHDKELWIDNTDGIGLIRDLQAKLYIEGKSILILGAGGAARGIIGPLVEKNPQKLVLANRTLARLKSLESDFQKVIFVEFSHLKGKFDLIINATSISIQDQIIELPEECFSDKPLCYDLAYKQGGLTSFMNYAKAKGCPVEDGLGMLVEQAAEAFYIWHHLMPDTKIVLKKLRDK